MDLRDKKVCFLGDSITAGVGVSAIENRYTEVFKRITGIRELKNYGVSATRIAKQQKVGEYGEEIDNNSFCERFGQMDDDADIVVVFGGTNDYGHGDAPFGNDNDREMNSFCGACHYLMNGLVNKYQNKIIVFMTPLHRSDENRFNEVTGLPLKAYVDAIKCTANQYSIPILDLYNESGIFPTDEENKQAFCPDGLHPNDEGAKRIASILAEFLKKL